MPFITITTKFLSKHCIKRVLDTEMNGYHCFNFTEKLSCEVYTLSNHKTSNFHFELSLKLSQAEVHAWLFRGGAKILRRGAKQSQLRCAPPHTSPQIPPCVDVLWYIGNYRYLLIILYVPC
jgi:hypothetical protein